MLQQQLASMVENLRAQLDTPTTKLGALLKPLVEGKEECQGCNNKVEAVGLYCSKYCYDLNYNPDDMDDDSGDDFIT